MSPSREEDEPSRGAKATGCPSFAASLNAKVKIALNEIARFFGLLRRESAAASPAVRRGPRRGF
jgi:hypothetical protein